MTPTRRQLAAWAELRNRRDRDATGWFLVEGRKAVAEFAQAGWAFEARLVLDSTPEAADEAEGLWTVTREQMERVSAFRTVPEVLAVVRRPLTLTFPRWTPGTLALVLDGIQDPGNVGTLVRTAAWFGLDAVFLSPDSADPFGPKAVQASMGAVARIRLGEADEAWWAEVPEAAPVLGTFLDGESLLGAELPTEGLVVLGNEGHGISPLWEGRATRRLTVPRFGSGAESLNVAAAAAVVLAELRRPAEFRRPSGGSR